MSIKTPALRMGTSEQCSDLSCGETLFPLSCAAPPPPSSTRCENHKPEHLFLRGTTHHTYHSAREKVDHQADVLVKGEHCGPDPMIQPVQVHHSPLSCLQHLGNAGAIKMCWQVISVGTEIIIPDVLRLKFFACASKRAQQGLSKHRNHESGIQRWAQTGAATNSSLCSRSEAN